MSGTRQSAVGSYLTVRNMLATLGTLLAAAAVSFVVGPSGLLIVIGVGGARYLLSTPTAFAIGQLLLVVLYPGSGPLSLLVLAELGLVCLLLSTEGAHRVSSRAVVATLVFGAVIGGGTWLGVQTTDTVWVGGTVVIVLSAVLAYALHRYERVAQHLVDPS